MAAGGGRLPGAVMASLEVRRFGGMLSVVDAVAQPIPVQARPPVRVVLAAVFGAMAACSWLIFGLVLLLIAPKFREIFVDFGVALPGVTLFFLGLAIRWALAGVLVVAAMGLSVVAACRGWGAVAVISLVLAWLATVSFVLAMQLPLMSLAESLGAGGR
jgi:hypothetical protein